MRIAAAACVVLSSGCAGCEFPGRVCGPESGSHTSATALVLASNSTYAFIAATWVYQPDKCDGEAAIGGAIHFVDLQPATPEVTLVSAFSSLTQPRGGVLVGDEFVVLLENGSYFTVRGADPTAFQTVPLTMGAYDIVGFGSEAFLRLEEDAVLVHGSGSDQVISTISGARGLTVAGGRLYVTGMSGEIAEIDIATRTEIRRLVACPNSGPATAIAGDSILMQCQEGGLGLFAQDGSFSVSLTDTDFYSVSAESGMDRALVSTDRASGGTETRLYILGTGLSPASGLSGLDDDAIFGPAFAYAVTNGFPSTIELLEGDATSIPGFTLSNRYSTQIDGRFPGGIAIAAGSGNAYEMDLVLVDAETGEAIGEPIPIPPPDPDLFSEP